MEGELNDAIRSLGGETGGGKGADLRRSADTDKGSCLSLSRAADDSGHGLVYKKYRRMLMCTSLYTCKDFRLQNNMRFTMLSAALAAVSLSQTVSAAAGSWLYTSKHSSQTTQTPVHGS
jgi:hypothetical protein